MATTRQSVARCGVYSITHTPTGDCYIGGSVDCVNRFTHHRYCLRRNNHKSSLLQKRWNDSKESDFMFSVVEECSKNELRVREQHYLDKTGDRLLNSGRHWFGKKAEPSQKRKDAARSLWSRPGYREEFLSRRDDSGRFTG